MSNRGRRGTGPQRILYWFRTPPGVKVGRGPIDEEGIRLLEQHNPDIQFDWSHILKAPPPAPAPARREERRGRDRRQGTREGPPTGSDRRSAARDSGGTEHTNQKTRATEYADYTKSQDLQSRVSAADPGVDPELTEPLAGSEPERVKPTEAIELPEPAEPPESAEVVEPSEAAELPEPGEPREPVLARLGPEGLARLRARYGEMMARIAEHPVDEATRDQLKLQAERLNPDTWVTADEVAQALEVYESVYEGLRSVVGTRHRGRRRGRRGGAAQ